MGGYPAGGGSRDPDANVTIINGGAAGSVVTINTKDDVTIDGFTMQNGSATNYGGGIYCYDSSPTITNNTIAGNSATYWGGGIYCYDSSPIIENNTITGNSASSFGGGICCYYYSWPTITNNEITGNSGNYGGGIHCWNNSSPTIENNTITGNSAGNYGGGICCTNDSSPTIQDNTITENSATSGGGIRCMNNSSPTITNNTITGNPAGDGAGIYCSGSSPTISNNTITGNPASNWGGGIHCYDSSPTIQDNTITGNSADSAGGGLTCFYYSSPTITDCCIADNTSAGGDGGGGVYCRESSSPGLTNCIIAENTASTKGGGISCVIGSSPTLTNCTIAKNTATFEGGGICCSGGSYPTVLNSILWDDEPEEISLDLSCYIDVTYSDVEDAWSGDGNINADPKFCSRGGITNYDGYFLKQENDGGGWPSSDWSPCIDAGDPGSDPFGGAANTEYSTAVNEFLDTNRVDMGYHYKYGGCTYIELVSFSARPVGSRIVLNWETGAEIDNAGFVVYRAIAGTFDYQQLSGLIPAQGTPTSGASYSFTDSDVEPGVSYDYWLVDIETSGKWTAHGPATTRLPLSIKTVLLPTADREGRLESPPHTANHLIGGR